MVDVISEPRAYWDVVTIPVTAQDTDPQTVVLDAQHFYNGERYPVTIENIAVSMINYARKSFQDSLHSPFGYDALSNILAGLKIVISARNRQSYSRYPINASSFVNTATDLLVPYYGAATAAADQFSSFFGTIHRRFEPHLILPKNGTLEFDLTPFAGYTLVSVPNKAVGRIAFHELGTIAGANSRVFTFDPLLAASAPSAAPFGPVLNPDPLVAPQNAVPQLWPPQLTVNPRSWKSQSPAAQGSAEFTGMSILIDQIDYDNANIIAATASTPWAMLAQRIGCRARLTDGGTKAWWWRPGAPLALVFPDITPALVYRFDRKITLGPGEQLEVEVTIPAVTTNAGNTPIAATYEFGLALNGYVQAEG